MYLTIKYREYLICSNVSSLLPSVYFILKRCTLSENKFSRCGIECHDLIYCQLSKPLQETLINFRTFKHFETSPYI